MPATAHRTYRGSSVPGPSHDTEDAILKARLAAANTEPFTAQHSAAYAAFAGIADRPTALKLHRHGINWDDLNAYCATGLLAATSYDLMIALSREGITPAVLQRWHRTLRPRRGNGVLNEIRSYVTGAASRTAVAAYMAHPIGQTLPANRLILLLRAGLDPDGYDQWLFTAGIDDVAVIATLHMHGCTPSLAQHLLTNASEAHYRNPAELAGHCLSLARNCNPDPHLLRAALLVRATPEHLAEWHRSSLDPDRAALFMCAGYTPNDWSTNEQVRAADDASLAMLAGLRGHRFALAA